MQVLPIPEDSPLDADDRAWLTTLVDDWHILADLAFSDLVLWVPEADDSIFDAVAQVRPATGPTALEGDVIGERIVYDPEELVTEAYLSGEISTTSGNKLNSGIPVDQHAIPLVRDGRVIAVLEAHGNRMGLRAPGLLEDAYVEISEILMRMLWRGDMPGIPHDDDPAATPRVGDGLIRVQPDGRVSYATPNATTAYRKLGLTTDLEGEDLNALTYRLAQLSRDAVDQAVGKRMTREGIADIPSVDASVRLRVIPLRDGQQDLGSFVLCRDTTELRSRERQLVTKDATIREIHHRVKNNLQTVAALLRMQSRRLDDPAAAGALQEAMSRVAAIAIVHEILSQAYDDSVQFDDVCDRILRSVGAVAASRGEVHARRVGSFGQIPGDAATNLALIVTEVCQNAVEHGLDSGSGEVVVAPERDGGDLTVRVTNDGNGLPEGFSLEGSSSLGLSIVQTLTHDLGGTFALANRVDGGVVATLSVPKAGLSKRS